MPTVDPRAVRTLAEMALDLTRSLSSEARFESLLDTIVAAIPCDAAAMLRFDGTALRPVALRGIHERALHQRFIVGEHPRLAAILRDHAPVRFSADDPRPDPYDGLVTSHDLDLHVHSCMGCSLYVGDKLVGVLTLDALEPSQFDDVDMSFFHGVAAMTAAALQVAELIELLEQTAKATQATALDLVSEALRRHGDVLVGDSEALKRIRGEIDLVASSNLTILVHGETGTGKEVVARTLHARSSRADKPLVYVNCAALPESLAESELFGHVRGSFTGATATRGGKFELAQGGTLFLDEIGELPLTLQPKLLRVLQFGEVQRVGSDDVHTVDVRVIAATNRNLPEAVREGRFRADLYHRLSVYPILLPPLRERPDDVEPLAEHLLERVRGRLGLDALRLTESALEALRRYSWPGNVRELEHELTRAALRASSTGQSALVPGNFDLSETDPLAPAPAPEGVIEHAPQSLRDATDRCLREHIRAAVAHHHGNWSAAARDLDLDRANLHRMAKRLGLK